MRIQICAVGRMKAGAERELASRYLDRFAKAAPAIGLELTGVAEIMESKARSAEQRKRDESVKLAENTPAGSMLALLDERGKSLTSQEFAHLIAKHRDAGVRNLTLAIGGADGHDAALREGAHQVISFGAMTFPHQIMRVMLAEQLYRAATILSGHPYHRE